MIRLHSLGACEIEIGDARLMPTSRMLFAAALYLAVEGARPILREQLQELLWPDADAKHANHSLRQTFYRFRAYGVPLDSDAERVILPPNSVGRDYDALLDPKTDVPSRELLARIPGGFLPGYMPRGSRALAEWVEAQRSRVNALLSRRFLAGITERKSAGDWPAVEALAQRCLELDSLNDVATVALAEAMAMTGSRARAIAVIDRYTSEIGPREDALRAPAVRLRDRIAGLYPAPAVIERDPPQIGREAEMGELDAALASARAGRGSAYLVSGPPGIGKTRIVSEFVRAAQLQGIRIARTTIGRHDRDRPLGAWGELTPFMQRMPGALGCDPASLPFLARLTESEPAPPAPGGAEFLFARIRLAILDLVSAVASESCVILMVEDVHWMDRWSWDVMSALTRQLDDMNVLLLATRRESEEDATPVPATAIMRAMPLAPLDASSSRRLFQLVTGEVRTADPAFVTWCVTTSVGNPYFLIELARRASQTEGRFQAPSSLTRLIAQRFETVTPLSRRVLQAAAVLGNNSTLTRIERVLDERPVALLDSLDELAREALILADGQQVICRHDLLGMSALSDVSPLSLKLLHHRAAEALETEMGELNEPGRLYDIARHREEAGEQERAVELLDRCAARAMALGTPAEAARALGYAMTILPPGFIRESMHARRIHALYLAREYSTLVGAAESERAARGTARDDGRAHSAEELFELDARLFSVGPSISIIEHASACAADPGADPDHRVAAALTALKASAMMDKMTPGRRAFRSVESALVHASPRLAAECRLVYFASVGSVEKGAREARRLLSLLEGPDQQALRAKALHQCAAAFFCNGEIDLSTACANEARALGLALHMPRIALVAAQIKAIDAIDLGDLDLAETAVNAIDQLAISVGDINERSIKRLRAVLAVLRGDLATAGRWIEPFTEIWGGEYSAETSAVVEVRARYRMLADGWTPGDAEMARLIQLHRACRRRRGADSLLHMIVELLEQRGELPRARALVERYLTRFRMERGPLMKQLREQLERLGFPIADPAAPRMRRVSV